VKQAPQVTIRPVWTIQDAHGAPPLPERLLALLVQVQAQGSLLAACERLGMSYRHGWALVRQGEARLEAPLLHMTRGKGSTLSPLGATLVWADRRITARLGPVLDSLASELASDIGQVLRHSPSTALRLHASHGFAVEALVQTLARQGVAVARRYGSSVEAAAALHDGSCDVAGLHIPEGPLQNAALAHYARWLADPDLVLIDVATRRQGLMLAPGNPRKLYELADLLRPGVRFINRQAGSGTRFCWKACCAVPACQRMPSPVLSKGSSPTRRWRPRGLWSRRCGLWLGNPGPTVSAGLFALGQRTLRVAVPRRAAGQPCGLRRGGGVESAGFSSRDRCAAGIPRPTRRAHPAAAPGLPRRVDPRAWARRPRAPSGRLTDLTPSPPSTASMRRCLLLCICF